jgi:hypothetical protein
MEQWNKERKTPLQPAWMLGLALFHSLEQAGTMEQTPA